VGWHLAHFAAARQIRITLPKSKNAHQVLANAFPYLRSGFADLSSQKRETRLFVVRSRDVRCSVVGLSALRFANSDSVPPSKAVGAALSSGQARWYWFFCRLSVVESRRVLIAPFIPLRGPFGPSLLMQLLRPLLTSATGSETISRPSVSNSRPVADLPR
jgi:hypothetical protein